MKQLSQYINEQVQSSQKLDNEHYQWMITPKTKKEFDMTEKLRKAFSYAAANFKGKKSLTNKTDMTALFAKLFGDKSHVFADFEKKMIIQALPSAAEFGNLVNDNFDIFLAKYRGIDKFLTQHESEGSKYAKQYYAVYKNDLQPIENIDNEQVDDDERLIVVRSKYGDGEVLYGVINKSDKIDDKLNHMLCGVYSKLTGVKYYEGRPILYDTWLNLPPERQQQTFVDGTDTEEFK